MASLFLRANESLSLFGNLKPRKTRTRKDGTKTEIPDQVPAIEQQIAAHGLPNPITEYQFAKAIGRNWRADYVWLEPWMILFEQEGGGFGNLIWPGAGAWTTRRHKEKGEWVKTRVDLPPNKPIRVGGGHNTGPGVERDIEKYNYAQTIGFMVIRGTTRQIRDGEAIAALKAAFTARGWKEPEAGGLTW